MDTSMISGKNSSHKKILRTLVVAAFVFSYPLDAAAESEFSFRLVDQKISFSEARCSLKPKKDLLQLIVAAQDANGSALLVVEDEPQAFKRHFLLSNDFSALQFIFKNQNGFHTALPAERNEKIISEKRIVSIKNSHARDTHLFLRMHSEWQGDKIKKIRGRFSGTMKFQNRNGVTMPQSLNGGTFSCNF
jgi:hypothetical protein